MFYNENFEIDRASDLFKSRTIFGQGQNINSSYDLNCRDYAKMSLVYQLYMTDLVISGFSSRQVRRRFLYVCILVCTVYFHLKRFI